MNDYISREGAIKKITVAQVKATTGIEDVAYYRAIKIIRDMPAADVQPVNQWISVKERQPDKDDLYLVAVENEICVYMDIADYSNNQWHKHDEVIYWQPLPELPKEG